MSRCESRRASPACSGVPGPRNQVSQSLVAPSFAPLSSGVPRRSIAGSPSELRALPHCTRPRRASRFAHAARSLETERWKGTPGALVDRVVAVVAVGKCARSKPRSGVQLPPHVLRMNARGLAEAIAEATERQPQVRLHDLPPRDVDAHRLRRSREQGDEARDAQEARRRQARAARHLRAAADLARRGRAREKAAETQGEEPAYHCASRIAVSCPDAAPPRRRCSARLRRVRLLHR